MCGDIEVEDPETGEWLPVQLRSRIDGIGPDEKNRLIRAMYDEVVFRKRVPKRKRKRKSI